jgi:hypothetical protein
MSLMGGGGGGQVDKNTHDIRENKGNIETNQEGVAMALAMDAPFVPEGSRFALAPSWGTFEGEHAFTVSGTVRVGQNVLLSGGAGYGMRRNSAGGRVGAVITW